MEILKLKQLQFFLFVGGVHLALLADIGFCDPPSATSVGVNSYSTSDVKAESICFDKYLSKSYFEKHDSLLDSLFESYISNELPIGLCGTLRDNLDAKLSVHKRHLIGEGSHRKLHYTIKISIQPDLIAEKFGNSWKFVILERLPSGVFADPFELQHLIGRGVFGDTNLEFPSIASNRSIVEVHIEISRDMLSTHDNGLKMEIQLPLHTRYPSLGEGISGVEFGSPDLFILGNIKGISPNQSCLLSQEVDAKSQTVVWEVPCGIKEHSDIVSVVTFVSAAVSAIVIVFTILRFPVCENRI